MATKRRPPKVPEPLQLARKLLAEGKYRDTTHAAERKAERRIILPEIVHVINQGFHEARKDEFKEAYRSWTYAIRGKTVDRRDLRVAVAFEDGLMLLVLVTAIDVTK